MMIAYQRRIYSDERSFGEIVYSVVDELADITFAEPLQLIITALFHALTNCLQLSEDVLQNVFDLFYAQLPSYIRNALKYTDLRPSEGIS